MSDAGRDDHHSRPRLAPPIDISRPDGHPRLSNLPIPVIVVVTVGLYLALARLGAIWSDDQVAPTALAPAAGVPVGIMMLVPKRRTFVVLLAAATASVAHDVIFLDPTWSDHVVLTGSRMLGALLYLMCLRWIFANELMNIEVRTLSVFAAAALVFAGTAVLVAGGLSLEDMSFGEAWITWLTGEGVGTIVYAAVFTTALIPLPSATARHLREHVPEVIGSLLVVVTIAIAAFSTTTPLALALIPVIAWISYRNSNWVGVPAVATVVTFTTIRTDQGEGPFAIYDHPLLWCQLLSLMLIFFAVLLGRIFWFGLYEEHNYRALIALLPDHVSVHSTDGEHLETLTPPGEKMDELSSTTITEHWDSITEQGLPATRVIHTARQQDLEIRLVPVGHETVLSVVRDITGEQELLRELERATAHWQRLASAAYEGYIEVGPDHDVLYVSNRWAEMHGMQPHEIVGRPFNDLFRESDWPQLRPYAFQVMAGERVAFEYAHTRPDGERRWALTSADGRVDADGYEGFVAFAADTTELHTALTKRDVAELRLATVERRERERIASFLHDGPLQTMVALSYRLNAIKSGADPAGAAAELEQTTLDAIADMREGLTELSPSDVTDGRVGDALLTSTARFWDQSSTTVTVDDRLGDRLDVDLASTLFLIGREAIVNAILHAHANTVRVTLGPFGGGYRLDVADDGIGVDPGAASTGKHLGLRSMIRRAQEAGGRVDVRPNEPTGTRVVAWVPENHGTGTAAVNPLPAVGEQR